MTSMAQLTALLSSGSGSFAQDALDDLSHHFQGKRLAQTRNSAASQE
jgi:hypothetical protein